GLQIKSNNNLGVTWLPSILYKNVSCALFGSIAGAQPKNDASEIPLYGDMSVRSAVRTTFGCFKCLYTYLKDVDFKFCKFKVSI
ncbi:MAG: hypothetical protein QOC42_02930, partial [Nitrososphaeraceae archaeon]|nr:hypothetical protein [Nitrososphaeraceae archaeon]